MAKTEAQLFKQQQDMNKGMAAAQGGAALFSQGTNMIAEAKSINTAAPVEMVDAFGKPVFNLGGFSSQVAAIKPKGASGGDIGSAAMTGAAAGAAFGAWGALIGGAVGALSATLFGRRKKKLMERKQRLAKGNLFAAQQSFNTQLNDYNSRQSAQSLYNETMNMDARMNNVYNAL